jgi:hypothetical protein
MSDPKMTKFGLTLYQRGGEWQTKDGAWSIGRAREITICEESHPQLLPRSQWTGELNARGEYVTRKGYLCPGGQEHDRECGWDIRHQGHNPPHLDDLFDTLTQAWRDLAAHLAG